MAAEQTQSAPQSGPGPVDRRTMLLVFITVALGMLLAAGRTTTLAEIATLYHLPPEVLAPAFAAAAASGYLTRHDGQLAVTEAGALDVAKLVTALKAWLVDGAAIR